jgi:DNA repair protein RadC
MIKDLPADQRPREKLLARGAGALADAELLALLLRTGTRGQGVLALAQALLDRCSGFAGLMSTDARALAALPGLRGLGPAKRAELLAVMEIARRALAEGLRAAPVFESPSELRRYCALQLAGLPHEVFAVMFLDARQRLLAFETVFTGTLTSTTVHPREVLKRALACNAAGVVLAHNHPSGVAEPSRADELITHSLRDALRLIDVRVFDHVVVGQGQVVSMAERGLL